ncbi:MAG: hypothetical protein JSS07_04065 [Proteobacteria bacterium]|nr:hypothetical protein [Pseudomonadota bacterium]
MKIDNSEKIIDIPKEIIDIPIKSQPKSNLAMFFEKAGYVLRKPFEITTGWIAKSIHITPGQVYQFSSNPTTDAKIKKLLKYFYLISGALGTIPTLMLRMVASGFTKVSLIIDPRPYSITFRETEPLKTHPEDELIGLCRNSSLFPPVMVNFHSFRDTDTRTQELINSILSPRDNVRPNFISLQEVFDFSAAQKLAKALNGNGYDCIFNMAFSPLWWNSGLFFATDKKIVHARFVTIPLPFFVNANNIFKKEFCFDAFAKKGILFVLIEHKLNQKIEYHIVINTHTKSEPGHDEVSEKAIADIRTRTLKLMVQELVQYIHELEVTMFKGIKIKWIFLNGDLNVSDVQFTGKQTNERSSADVKFFFGEKGIFPGEGKDTWLRKPPKDEYPMEDETGWGQKNVNHNQLQHCIPNVRFDHFALLEWRQDLCPAYRSIIKSKDKNSDIDVNVNPSSQSPEFIVEETSPVKFLKVWDDQNASDGKTTPISDHAGLLYKVKP